MTNFSEIVIRSEDDAWNWLKIADSGDDLPKNPRLKFEGWPIYRLHVTGDDWHQSVPTRIMPPLLDIQKDLNRAFAQIRYGEPNIRRLKDDEKDLLEIIVQVKDGSSDYEAKLAGYLDQLVKSAMEKMEPRDYITIVLIVALAWGGTVTTKNWLETRLAEKGLEISASQSVELSKQETARLELMASVVQQHPDYQEIPIHVEDATNRVLRTLKSNDSVDIGGVRINGFEAKEIAREARQTSTDVELVGVFKILRNDVGDPTVYKLRLQSLETSEEFNAFVRSEVPSEQRQIIQDAEWSIRKMVHLTIQATRLRGALQDAEIVSVKTASDEMIAAYSPAVVSKDSDE